MDVDAEALISCSTITSSGVTSTSPMQLANMKVNLIDTSHRYFIILDI